ncbi:hypothetical protein [Fusibacter sp. 3D3]|uniref:hypothetical protein n=1 Tax=Fusibacter sp. 3D3 TaxID=1048380 RepID=UPI0008533784|nr:hypothetical protein [Fusibacter sp. 3D3]GAU77862.1 hypothetical protein F3D3_2491 [Fusibacter sp. 3D3]
MSINLHKRLYPIKHQTEGLAGIGLLLFMISVLVLLILPISIGLLEFQFLNIEKEQVKTATENTVNLLYESVASQPLSKVVAVPDLSEFKTVLSKNLSALKCNAQPEEVAVEFVEEQWLVITFTYKHEFKSLDLQKNMSVFLKYWMPSDQ